MIKYTILGIMLILSLVLMSKGQNSTGKAELQDGPADSNLVFNAKNITDRGTHEFCILNFRNMSGSLTDSIKFYHISEQGDTIPLWYREVRPPGAIWGSDTLHSLLIVPPSTKKEILLWYPFPVYVGAYIANAGYSTSRRDKVTYRFVKRM